MKREGRNHIRGGKNGKRGKRREKERWNKEREMGWNKGTRKRENNRESWKEIDGRIE